MNHIWLVVLPATIPTLVVLVGILLNQTGIGPFESRMSAMENRLAGRIDKLAAKIVALRKQLHDDIVTLIVAIRTKSERLARLEERNKGN